MYMLFLGERRGPGGEEETEEEEEAFVPRGEGVFVQEDRVGGAGVDRRGGTQSGLC